MHKYTPKVMQWLRFHENERFHHVFRVRKHVKNSRFWRPEKGPKTRKIGPCNHFLPTRATKCILCEKFRFFNQALVKRPLFGLFGVFTEIDVFDENATLSEFIKSCFYNKRIV